MFVVSVCVGHWLDVFKVTILLSTADVNFPQLHPPLRRELRSGRNLRRKNVPAQSYLLYFNFKQSSTKKFPCKFPHS